MRIELRTEKRVEAGESRMITRNMLTSVPSEVFIFGLKRKDGQIY